MIRSAMMILAGLTPCLPAQSEQDSQAYTVSSLVAEMRERQKPVTTAYLEMTTRGSYPGGVTFEIQGSIRVLGETHFHSSHRSTFEEAITVETERVVTPDGAWMREKDPAFGEVYLAMGRALSVMLRAATAELAGEGGGMDNPAKDPLGSAMIESLNKEFDLTVQKRVINSRDYLVVDGPRLAAADSSGADGRGGRVPTPDRVELLVRLPDLAVVQMTQFKDGAELMKIETTVLELNRPMKMESFRIDLPEGKSFKSVKDHPPAWAQIQRQLKLAEDQRAARKADEKKG